MIVFYHAMEVFVITPFGWLNHDYVCALLLWGLLLVSTSQVFSKSAQDVKFFHIDL
jgi:hypothetical protein